MIIQNVTLITCNPNETLIQQPNQLSNNQSLIVMELNY